MAGRRGVGLRVVAVLVSTLLCVVAAECALRVAGVEYPAFYEADAIAGARHVPGASGWQTLEGRAFVSINSQGMRDREHTFAKPAGTFRIAVIGDSYAEAMQVDAQAAFWSLLEGELAGCAAIGGRRVESLNFGVSGFGTAQQLRVLEHKALAYDPDLVLLPFVLNDVRNNHRGLEGEPGKPYYVLRGAALELDDSFLGSSQYLRSSSRWGQQKAWIRRHSRIAQLVDEARRIPVRLAQRPQEGRTRDDGVFFPPRTKVWAEAWAVTEALVERIAEVATEHGSDFLLVVVSDGEQVNPDPAVRSRAADRLGVADLYYYEDRIRAFADEVGVDSLGLARPFLEHAERTGECLHGFENARPCRGHWNDAGHRLAAELMAEAVCEQVALGSNDYAEPGARASSTTFE